MTHRQHKEVGYEGRLQTLGRRGVESGTSDQSATVSRKAMSGGETVRGTRAKRSLRSWMHVSKCTSPAITSLLVNKTRHR